MLCVIAGVAYTTDVNLFTFLSPLIGLLKFGTFYLRFERKIDLSWLVKPLKPSVRSFKTDENTHLVCNIDDFSFMIKSQSSGMKKLSLPAHSIPVALCTTSQRSNFAYPLTIITRHNSLKSSHCLNGWKVKHIFQQPNTTSFPWKIFLNPGTRKFVM